MKIHVSVISHETDKVVLEYDIKTTCDFVPRVGDTISIMNFPTEAWLEDEDHNHFIVSKVFYDLLNPEQSLTISGKTIHG